MFGTSRCGSHHRSHFHGHGFFQQPGGYGPGGFSMGRDDEGFGGFGKGGGFGVRRPLRFLAYKLGLDEKQVVELARILDELKTERAQAEVDDRRTLAEFADALAGETFDAAKATSAGDRRVASAGRLREKLVASLQQIHALLTAEQRAHFAYLIRTGVLAV
jgi:Spy/CpxP family protein refolding chaperone